MVEKLQQAINESKAARWAMLALVSFTMLAAYYFVDTIAPLESLFYTDTYKWTTDNYGFFSGSEYYLNIMGFLIISGIILDKMGVRFTGLLACTFMVLGGLIKFYALSPAFRAGGPAFDLFNSFWAGMPATAKLAAVGYAIFGIGVEMSAITISRALVKWFKGKEIGLAMGMQLATARMGASIAFWFSATIAGYEERDGLATGDVQNPLALGLALVSIGFLTFLVYTFFDRRLDRETGRTSDANPDEAFHLKDLGKIVTNPGFLIISLLCVLFYSGVFPFLKYAVKMMQVKLGVSAQIGGLISGLLPVGTIILTPIFGHYLDRKGKGASIMILGAFLLTAAHFTFALVPLTLPIAIAAIIVLGIAFSLIPASMWPSVPKIVPDRYLGSAFALVFFIQNIGLGLVPWLIGLILEATNEGRPPSAFDYTAALLVFASLGVAAVVLAFGLKAIDRKHGYGLELPNKKS